MLRQPRIHATPRPFPSPLQLAVACLLAPAPGARFGPYAQEIQLERQGLIRLRPRRKTVCRSELGTLVALGLGG